MDTQEPVIISEHTEPAKKSFLSGSIKFVYAAFIITIIAAGVTVYTLSRIRALNAENDAFAAQVNAFVATQNKTILPTAFRAPTPDGAPHIVGATIERITIPDCKDCYADIVKTMPGAAHQSAINDINSILTSSIYNKDAGNSFADIRIVKNRILAPDVQPDDLQSKILYYDSATNMLNFWLADQSDFGGAHPNHDTGTYYYIDLSRPMAEGIYSSEGVLDFGGGGGSDDENSKNIVEHFYPNYKNLYNPIDEVVCADADSQYVSGVDLNTKEVIFHRSYGGDRWDCDSNDPRIAIPIADILKEVPEFVPKDSILWRFK